MGQAGVSRDVRSRIDGWHQEVEFGTALGAGERQSNGMEQAAPLLPGALSHLLGRLAERLTRQSRPGTQFLRKGDDHRPASLRKRRALGGQVLHDGSGTRRFEHRPQPLGRIRQLVDGAGHE